MAEVYSKCGTASNMQPCSMEAVLEPSWGRQWQHWHAAHVRSDPDFMRLHAISFAQRVHHGYAALREAQASRGNCKAGLHLEPVRITILHALQARATASQLNSSGKQQCCRHCRPHDQT